MKKAIGMALALGDSFYLQVISGVCGLLFTNLLSISAADWPQYRGPNSDGTTPEKIMTKWPANGLRQLWKVPTPDGFSSLAVTQEKAFTQVVRTIDGVPREVCVALDAGTGKELWAVPVGMPKYENGGNAGAPENNGGDGPRSTPTVNADRVYVLSSQLTLYCLELGTGKTLWLKDLVKEYGARNIAWKNAASPLIDGDLIFLCAGGQGQSLLAIDKTDGRAVWKKESDQMTHATPVVATIHGVRQVIFSTQSGLVAVLPAQGDLLWRYRFPYGTSTAASPVVGGEIVFCSAGYIDTAGACRISKSADGFTATEIWRKRGKEHINHWSTPVKRDGYLYGLFGFKDWGKAPLKCIEMATGKEIWSEEGFGQGGTILVDGRILVLSENGHLVLVEATPRNYVELARTKAVTGKCWNNPAVCNGRIYARSTKEGVCLDVSVKTAQQ